jgi:hypothetical protein
LSDPVAVDFNGGTPTTATGSLAGSFGNPVSYTAGFGYTAGGNICARDVVPDGFNGGIGRSSNGSIAFAVDPAIVGYTAGVPITADGRLAIEFEGPPPDLQGAYDSSFDNAFDIVEGP